MHRVPGGQGIRPIGVPEVDPTSVAVLFVNEDAPGGVNSTGRDRREVPLRSGIRRIRSGQPSSGRPRRHVRLARRRHRRRTSTATRTTALSSSRAGIRASVSLPERIAAADICSQNPTQTHCYGPGTTLQRASRSSTPTRTRREPEAAGSVVRGVDLYGGCGTVAPPYDSNPYFNVDDGIDLLRRSRFTPRSTSGPASATPGPLAAECARVTASPGGPMTYVGRRLGGLVRTRHRVGAQRGEHHDAVQEPEREQLQHAEQPERRSTRVAVPYVADDDSGSSSTSGSRTPEAPRARELDQRERRPRRTRRGGAHTRHSGTPTLSIRRSRSGSGTRRRSPRPSTAASAARAAGTRPWNSGARRTSSTTRRGTRQGAVARPRACPPPIRPTASRPRTETSSRAK